jgi:hypothetical protein
MADEESEYLIEFRRIGAYVKVSALDPQSGTEVSIVGSPQASEAELTRVATQKLRYMLAKGPSKA